MVGLGCGDWVANGVGVDVGDACWGRQALSSKAAAKRLRRHARNVFINSILPNPVHVWIAHSLRSVFVPSDIWV